MTRATRRFALAPQPLPRTSATLAERGFSAEVASDARQTYDYDYERVSWPSPWKLMPGRYTRPGDVSELVAKTDDLFVVARPGDALSLEFDARRRVIETAQLLLDSLARRLDAQLPARGRRLQQGDEYPLGEPGRGRPASVPRHGVLPVSARGRVGCAASQREDPGGLRHPPDRTQPVAARAGGPSGSWRVNTSLTRMLDHA